MGPVSGQTWVQIPAARFYATSDTSLTLGASVYPSERAMILREWDGPPSGTLTRLQEPKTGGEGEWGALKAELGGKTEWWGTFPTKGLMVGATLG